jgi:tetratricopeptide (TPR) repeat protein
LFYLSMGRWEDALKFLNASLAQDPLDPTCYFNLSWVQVRRGRLSEAETAMRRTLEISPTFTFAHYFLGLVLLARNEPEVALAEMQKETADSGRLEGSAMAYFALDRKRDSDAALAQLLKSHADNPFGIAGVYAFRGQSDEAFRWLDLAYAQKDIALNHIKGEIPFKNVVGDPRYKAFLKKMNLPE